MPAAGTAAGIWGSPPSLCSPTISSPSGGPSQDRIRDAAALAKMYGLGMELEMDDRVFNDLDKYNKYLDYLNGGVKYGFIGPNSRVYRNWYNGIKTLLEASTGVNPYTGKADPVARALYDFYLSGHSWHLFPQPYRTLSGAGCEL